MPIYACKHYPSKGPVFSDIYVQIEEDKHPYLSKMIKYISLFTSETIPSWIYSQFVTIWSKFLYFSTYVAVQLIG